MPDLGKKIKAKYAGYLAEWFDQYCKEVKATITEDDKYIILYFRLPNWEPGDKELSLSFEKDMYCVRLHAWEKGAALDGGPMFAYCELTGQSLWLAREVIGFAIRILFGEMIA